MSLVRNFLRRNKPKSCCLQNANTHRRRNRGPERDKEPAAAKRCEPNFGFALRCEVSDQEMLRVVPRNRDELSCAHYHLSLIALRGTHRTETLKGQALTTTSSPPSPSLRD